MKKRKPTDHVNLNKKKSQVLLLLKLAEVDSFLDNKEEQFIKEIALQLGLSETDFEEVKKDPGNIYITLPQSEKERMTIFYHLLFLMKLSGRITKEEKELCIDLGFRLGLNPLLVEELISIMDEYASSAVPQGILIDTVKKYLN